jgi:hypothetical protein
MFFGGVPAKIEKSEKKPTKEEEEQKGERGKEKEASKKLDSNPVSKRAVTFFNVSVKNRPQEKVGAHIISCNRVHFDGVFANFWKTALVWTGGRNEMLSLCSIREKRKKVK